MSQSQADTQTPTRDCMRMRKQIVITQDRDPSRRKLFDNWLGCYRRRDGGARGRAARLSRCSRTEAHFKGTRLTNQRRKAIPPEGKVVIAHDIAVDAFGATYDT